MTMHRMLCYDNNMRAGFYAFEFGRHWHINDDINFRLEQLIYSPIVEVVVRRVSNVHVCNDVNKEVIF